MSRPAGDPVARFWAKVDKDGFDGCWLWTGYLTALGYGRFYRGGKAGNTSPAHRVSYELLVGPIPDGLEIDHLCRIQSCVNPAHLEAVTHAENIRRGMTPITNRAIRAALTTCKNGHPFDRRDARTGKRKCSICHIEAARRHREKKRVA